MDCNDRSQSAKLAKTEDPGSRPQWNYDVLVYLFRYVSVKTLCVCAQVCQSWELAAYDPALWRNAKPRIKNFNLGEETAKSLKTRNIKTVILDVIESEDSSLTMLFSNLAKYAQIENLTFIWLVTDCSITRHLPNLFTSLLRMEVNHSAISFMTREGLVGLFSPLVNLEQLCISKYYDRNGKEEEEGVIIEKNPRFDYFEVVLFKTDIIRGSYSRIMEWFDMS